MPCWENFIGKLIRSPCLTFLLLGFRTFAKIIFVIMELFSPSLLAACGIGVLLAFLFFCVLALIMAVILLVLLGVPGLMLSYFLSKEGERLSNCLSTILGVTLFSLLFSLFTFINYFAIICSDRHAGPSFGDVRYVRIGENYLYESIDGLPFYIEGPRDYSNIDSIADYGDWVYGKSHDKYFALSMADSTLKEDSLFANLELPDACDPSNFRDGESFYAEKCGNVGTGPSLFDVMAKPFFWALLISGLSSFFVKKVVQKIENWIRDWRARRKTIEE